MFFFELLKVKPCLEKFILQKSTLDTLVPMSAYVVSNTYSGKNKEGQLMYCIGTVRDIICHNQEESYHTCYVSLDGKAQQGNIIAPF